MGAPKTVLCWFEVSELTINGCNNSYLLCDLELILQCSGPFSTMIRMGWEGQGRGGEFALNAPC